MAVIGENNRRVANVGTVTAQTNATASFTPAANKLLLFMVGCYVSDARSIATPTLSDTGGRTWDFVGASSLSSDSKRKLFLYTCVSNSNPSAGVVTIDSGTGNTTDNMGWAISELNFARIDNDNKVIRQTANATTGAATTLSTTLITPDSANSLSATIFWVGTNQTPTYTGGTIGMMFGGGSIIGGFGYAYKNNDATPTLGFTSDSMIMYSFEVMAPLSGGYSSGGHYLRVGDGMSRSEVAN